MLGNICESACNICIATLAHALQLWFLPLCMWHALNSTEPCIEWLGSEPNFEMNLNLDKLVSLHVTCTDQEGHLHTISYPCMQLRALNAFCSNMVPSSLLSPCAASHTWVVKLAGVIYDSWWAHMELACANMHCMDMSAPLSLSSSLMCVDALSKKDAKM